MTKTIQATSYTAFLMDCPGVKDDDAREAEGLFCAAVERALGGPAKVAAAYLAYKAAFDAHGTIPLPVEATDAERAAVECWENAENDGVNAAFESWLRRVDSAYFEINVSAE